MKEYIKQSDYDLKVRETKTKEDVYGYDWLLNKKALLEQRRAKVLAEIDNELSWVNGMITEADKLGIKEKPKEEEEKESVVKEG
jgi:hypothetical protein